MDVLKFIFRLIFGNVIAGFAAFFSWPPMNTLTRIITNRLTEQFSSISYMITLSKCLLLAWYCLPYVTPNNILVSAINGMGAAIEVIYLFVFIMLAPKSEKDKLVEVLMFVASFRDHNQKSQQSKHTAIENEI